LSLLDLTLPTAAENLACDEALLDAAEAGGRPALLRFWEASRHFVVLGLANKVAEEINVTACRARGVPILRRCSGGGTVLQGPGCLNYALILPIEESGPLATVASTNRFIMQRHQSALATLLNQSVSVEGHTDLALAERKFSGNAQRRRRQWLLFHGTFLIDLDLSLLEQLVKVPPRQPAYRQQRGHADFLMRLPLRASQVKAGLQQAWGAEAKSLTVPWSALAHLVSERYGRDEWNLKW
jgi:lipoate-protein ligase A